MKFNENFTMTLVNDVFINRVGYEQYSQIFYRKCLNMHNLDYIEEYFLSS
jgi:hypothetical protein